MKFVMIILLWHSAATTVEFDSKSACYQAQEALLKAWNGGGIWVLCTPKGDAPQ